MQAIQTRYIGPTNTRGSRVKAYSEAFPRGVIVPFDHSLNTEARLDVLIVRDDSARETEGA